MVAVFSSQKRSRELGFWRMSLLSQRREEPSQIMKENSGPE